MKSSITFLCGFAILVVCLAAPDLSKQVQDVELEFIENGVFDPALFKNADEIGEEKWILKFLLTTCNEFQKNPWQIQPLALTIGSAGVLLRVTTWDFQGAVAFGQDAANVGVNETVLTLLTFMISSNVFKPL